MRARHSLAGLLLWLAGCGDPIIIGSAYEGDGGADDADQKLAQYAIDLEGRWLGMTPEGDTFVVSFKPSLETARSGTALSTLVVDCGMDFRSLIFCRPSGPPLFKAEYWLLKLQVANATLILLPDSDNATGFSVRCQYALAQQILDCGIGFGGTPIIEVVLKRDP